MADPAIIALFNAAIDNIEKVARVAPAESDDLAAAFVYSGGSFPDAQRQIPAIHLTVAAAVDDWQERVAAYLRGEQAATFRFAEVPKVKKLIMTETGEDGGQRLTATRYGVTSKVTVLSRVVPADNDGIALTSIEQPEGLVDKIADAIRDGRLKTTEPKRRRKR